jgi:organic hydroperoxide reductase OsmC/OhrA
VSGKHDYVATVVWERGGAPFTDNKYSRAHQWRFDGGTVVPASSSPGIVALPMSDAAAVDPEEAFVASLSSCHMLFFLSYAAARGFVVDRYEDAAMGTMGRNTEGRIAMLTVVLRPRVTWSGEKQPTAAEVSALHERSHHDCFIASSVRSEVRVEG